MKRSFTKKLVSPGNAVATLPLRIVIGLIFIAHGAQKLFGWFEGGGIKGTADFLSGLGLEPGNFMAYTVGIGEFLGGILLLLGLFTRAGSALIIIIMLTAIWKVHFEHGLTGNMGMEFPLTLLTGAIIFLISGAGKLSIDRIISRKKTKSSKSSSSD